MFQHSTGLIKLFGVLIVAHSWLTSPLRMVAADEDQSHRMAVQERLVRLEHFRVTYTSTNFYSGPNGESNRGGAPVGTPEIIKATYTRSGNSVRTDHHSGDYLSDIPFFEAAINRPNRSEILFSNRGNLSDGGGIAWTPLNVGLGIQMTAATELLSRNHWFECDLQRNDDGNIVLTKVLDGRLDGLSHRWEFDRENYALLAYDLLIERDGRTVIARTIRNSEFREVSGIRMPFRIVHKKFRSTGVMEEETTFKISNYEILDEPLDESSFQIKWPRGSEVLDKRTDSKFVVREHGHVLTDEVIAEEYVRKPDPRERTSRLMIVLICFGAILGLIIYLRLRKRHAQINC